MLYRSLNKYHYIADIDIDKPVSLRTSVTITVALVAMVITVLVGLFHA